MQVPSATTETVMDPHVAALANVYAQALLGLVPDEEALELTKELQDLTALIGTIEGFEELVAAAGTQRQSELVHHVFGGRCSELAQGLLATLAHNGRLGLLPLVAQQFLRCLYARQGHVEVTVITARELDEQHRQAMGGMLEQVIGAKPLLRTKVDASLLGGAVVRIGDRQYDGSVAGGLERMRRRLREAAAAAMKRQERGHGDHEA